MDPERRRELLTFVVAGGGPAGVETASELHHLLSDLLPEFYACAPEARVILVEGGDRILRGWDPELARAGRRRLEERGVEMELETLVADADGRTVEMGDGRQVPARTLVWTAGVAPHPLPAEAGLPEEDGAVEVDEHLRVRGHGGLYAVGDLSGVRNPRTGDPYPPVAPLAISQGVRAAGNLANERAGRPPAPYRAHHAGKLVSLGAGHALVEVLGLRLSGHPAWLTHRAAYLLKLVGFRNKLQVAFTLGLNALFGRDLTTGWRPGADRGEA